MAGLATALLCIVGLFTHSALLLSIGLAVSVGACVGWCLAGNQGHRGR
jgi:hypothetical protein